MLLFVGLQSLEGPKKFLFENIVFENILIQETFEGEF